MVVVLEETGVEDHTGLGVRISGSATSGTRVPLKLPLLPWSKQVVLCGLCETLKPPRHLQHSLHQVHQCLNSRSISFKVWELIWYQCWCDRAGSTLSGSQRLPLRVSPLLFIAHTHRHTHARNAPSSPFLSRCALRHGVFSSLPVLLYLTLIHANIAFSSAAFFLSLHHCLVYLDFGQLWILCYEVYCDLLMLY